MEWVLGAIVVWLLLSRRRDRGREGRGGDRRRGGVMRDVTLPDGRQVLNVEGSLFAPTGDDTAGWRWVALEGTADAQLQHSTTVAEVLAGTGNAGGGRAGTAPGVEVEAVPVILLPTGTRRRVRAVDAYATGGRLGHLSVAMTARYGAQLREVVRVEGRPPGVEARIGRGTDGLLRTEVLLPDAFEPTPPR